MASKKKKKHGGGSKAPLIITFIIIIAGGVVASNYVGPKKGWITGDSGDDKLAHSTDDGDSPGIKIDIGDSGPNNDSGSGNSGSDTAPPKDVKKVTEADKLYDQFKTEYLEQRAKKYDPAKEYTFVTPNNKFEAFITKIDDENMKVHIRKKQYNLKSSIHYSMLTPQMRYFLFQDLAAKAWANRKLEEYLVKNNAIKTLPDPEPAASNDPSKPAAKATSGKYDVTVTNSSPRLSHAALEVKNYLTAQIRVGKKKDGYEFAKVSESHAKQQGSKAVFYLYVTDPFASTSKEYQYQMVDGIRRFWALRCMSNGVAVDSKSLLCVVHNGRVIGGSKLDNAEEIFIR